MEYLHTMVRVSNLEQSLDFFCNKFGLVETRRIENEKGRYTLVFLAAPGDVEKAKDTKAPLLELTYNWDEHEYAGGRNFGHLAYRVDDIYATCQKLMDSGVTINRPPRDGYMAFIKTPDNISIELLSAVSRSLRRSHGRPCPTPEPGKPKISPSRYRLSSQGRSFAYGSGWRKGLAPSLRPAHHKEPGVTGGGTS